MKQLRLPGRPLTLTTRLVAVVVLLVAVTALAIGTATTIAMRENLDRRLDQDVRAALSRTLEGPSAPRPQAPDGSRDDFGPGQELGSLSAVLPDDATPRGMVLSDGRGWDPGTALTDEQLAALAGLEESDRDLRTVRLPGLATLVGIALAAVAAVVVVRRQLAPLREVAATAHRVAELPLASGEIAMAERVPAGLTDERTEIGQVGSALNAMLDHDRHRPGQGRDRVRADDRAGGGPAAAGAARLRATARARGGRPVAPAARGGQRRPRRRPPTAAPSPSPGPRPASRSTTTGRASPRARPACLRALRARRRRHDGHRHPPPLTGQLVALQLAERALGCAATRRAGGR